MLLPASRRRSSSAAWRCPASTAASKATISETLRRLVLGRANAGACHDQPFQHLRHLGISAQVRQADTESACQRPCSGGGFSSPEARTRGLGQRFPDTPWQAISNLPTSAANSMIPSSSARAKMRRRICHRLLQTPVPDGQNGVIHHRQDKQVRLSAALGRVSASQP